ncbi:MAG TPA: DoxX family protein [Steroidobacteraceae bacterium]|nr:DoxX family protein [Steroidobacteraceae bacterium]
MNTSQNLADLAGRIMISAIFLVTGLGKIAGYAATQGYMTAMGVPAMLLPLVIALEVGGSIAIILGWHTRIVASLLGGFSVLAALIFHHALGDQVQFLMFMKNIAIAGGFLLLVARGPGEWSLDGRAESLGRPGRSLP